MTVKTFRGRVVTPNTIIDDGVVVLDGGVIAWIGESIEAADAGYGDEVLAASAPTDDRYILPGLVDVHCHGGGGESFPNAETREQVLTAIKEHRRHGTTAMVASLVTDSPMVLRERAELLAEVCVSGELEGIHFEGPFVAYNHRGAQSAEHIQAPNPALTRELIIASRGYAVTMTIAPEKPYVNGSGGVVDTLLSNGALPSFGHTDTDAKHMRETLRETREMLAHTPNPRCPRATITHLFNGMAPMHHRDPGPIMEILDDSVSGGVMVELIGDGVHVAPDMVRGVYDLLGRENIALVTDAMAAAGLADGDYVLGVQAVKVADGVATLVEGGNIAGGTSHLLDQIKIVTAAGIPMVDAVYCASVSGARIIGDESLGGLVVGKRGDLIVTDPNLNPIEVYRKGELVNS
ncbi:MAG: amidohydrolase family protein [Varibaculum sp.]|nr:amidohydrolase family protein [Varibaculum sp.]